MFANMLIHVVICIHTHIAVIDVSKGLIDFFTKLFLIKFSRKTSDIRVSVHHAGISYRQS